MKKIRILFLLTVMFFCVAQMYSQILPADPPGGGFTGSGTSVPLDGGILLALLAAGGIGASLFAKSKKKDK